MIIIKGGENPSVHTDTNKQTNGGEGGAPPYSRTPISKRRRNDGHRQSTFSKHYRNNYFRQEASRDVKMSGQSVMRKRILTQPQGLPPQRDLLTCKQ